MSTIDTRPQAVDLIGYAGDTLPFTITVSADYSAYTWSGQVRSVHDVDSNIDAPDATFDIGTPVDNQDGTWTVSVSLSSVNTSALATLSQADDVPLTYTKIGASTTDAPSLQTYKGVWDIQVSDGGVPPFVRTLVQGNITIDADVTRA